ncbi:hypothetical protein [Streptomyces sp. NPDC020965]
MADQQSHSGSADHVTDLDTTSDGDSPSLRSLRERVREVNEEHEHWRIT